MRRSVVLLATALAIGGAPALAAPDRAGDVRVRIDAIASRAYPQLAKLYVDLHEHPELGFQERRTAARLAGEMRRLGFEVTTGVGKTGVVAVLRNGDGPVVLVRTELDALPVREETGLPYASKATGTLDGKTVPVMHACGHDIHMSWWLGTAKVLAGMKDTWAGTLLFVGQPAEETISGAQAMVDDGLFKRWPKPDYGFAAHVGPLPLGFVALKDGVTTSSSDTIRIRFNGVGAHGSMPDRGIDPIVMASHFVSDVQTVISREKDPNAFGVVTVGSFHAGSAANIIPDHADLLLTLRATDAKTRHLQIEGVERTAKAVAAMARAPAPDIAKTESAAMVVNDSKLAARLNGTLGPALGQGFHFIPATVPAGSGSEDFSVFVEQGVPSAYFGIGGISPEVIARYKAEGKALPVNHSPLFAPDPEPSIREGIRVLSLAVLTVAGTPGNGAAR